MRPYATGHLQLQGAFRNPHKTMPAVVRAAREVGGGGLSILALPPRPSPTAGDRGALGCFPGWDSTLSAGEAAQPSAESQPERFT
jgi:hypothetical protein